MTVITTPSRIRRYDMVVITVVALLMVLTSALVVGLFEPGHPAHAHHAPAVSPSNVTRSILSFDERMDVKTVLSGELHVRGYERLPESSKRPFISTAKYIFPYAKRPVVTDVFAKVGEENHWLVVASAKKSAPDADWNSAIVVKRNGTFVVSREHATFHNQVREAVKQTLNSK